MDKMKNLVIDEEKKDNDNQKNKLVIKNIEKAMHEVAHDVYQINNIIKKTKFGNGLGCHIWKVEADKYGNHAEILLKHYMPKIPKIGCFQIFSHGPRHKGLVKESNPEQIYELAKKIPLYIHSSYVTSPQKNLKHIVDQFQAAHKYGAQGVIIHIPKVDISVIVELTINIINAINNDEYFAKIYTPHLDPKTKLFVNKCDKNNIPLIPKIIWEAKALTKSKESLETPNKWNELASALEKIKIYDNVVGLNVDTAHIYASGANITTAKEASDWLGGLSPLCIKYIKTGLLHLNGNEYDHYVRAGDKHTVPGSANDSIWKNIKDITNIKESGCAVFINWYRSHNIPIILELKHDEIGIDNISNFANKFN